ANAAPEGVTDLEHPGNQANGTSFLESQMQIGSLQYPHYPAKDFAEHHHFLQIMAGTYDSTFRNMRLTKNMYEGSSFIAAYPVERVPKMPLSGISTRAGDLARFTFKGLQANKVQQCYVHMVSYQVVTLSGSGNLETMSLFESSITGNILNDGNTSEISGITAGQLATVLTAHTPLTETATNTASISANATGVANNAAALPALQSQVDGLPPYALASDLAAAEGLLAANSSSLAALNIGEQGQPIRPGHPAVGGGRQSTAQPGTRTAPATINLAPLAISAHLLPRALLFSFGALHCQPLLLRLCPAFWPSSGASSPVPPQGTADATQHMLAVIRKFAPSTLERYLRIAQQFLGFLEACNISFDCVTLAAVLDYLAAARASRSQDLEIHRISATSAIKALRWFHKLSQWEQLTPAMQSPVISAYSSRSTAKDRKEALPIPMAIIAAWEQRVGDPHTPLSTVLILGAALLAIHASLRFGDIQRVDFASLSLTTVALHGSCFATKTTSQGQPFAVTLAGITGRDTHSCWPLHWLAALQRGCSPFRDKDGDPDFLWVSTAPDLRTLVELAPASYCTAMLALRWAATLPWPGAIPGLTAREALQLTLHSMKSTVLASAAQLRLSKDIRLSQGHHRDSAALYSRNDTFDSLYAQRRLSLALSRGWRPERSIA
ncbi:unnamed protein product, partial [Symbiodinium necroappetens]